jgi:hypothetical protein
MGLLRVSNFFTVSTVLPHQLFIRNVTGLWEILAIPVCSALADLRNGSSPSQYAYEEVTKWQLHRLLHPSFSTEL